MVFSTASSNIRWRLCAFHVDLRFHNKELNFSSFLFVVHCIDDISNYNLFKKDLLLKEFESQDLDDLPTVFSKIIKMLYSAVVDLLKGETYTRFTHICDIYYRLVSPGIRQILHHVLLLIYYCIV